MIFWARNKFWVLGALEFGVLFFFLLLLLCFKLWFMFSYLIQGEIKLHLWFREVNNSFKKSRSCSPKMYERVVYSFRRETTAAVLRK